MKSIIKNILLALLPALILLAGCKEEMSYDDGENQVSVNLVSPEDNTAWELFNSSVSVYDFAWEANNESGAPYYQIVFYAGDGSTELYRVAPAERKILIPVPGRTLNAVAALAGIKPNTSGDVYWAVASVKGTSESISEKRKLNLTSYKAFDDVPVNVYITGGASEGGSNPAEAPQFRNNGNGTFEIYTLIKASDNFRLTNRNSTGDGRTFAIKEGTLVESGESNTVTGDGIYFINLDFISGTASITPVTDVRYFDADANAYSVMEYQGYAKWKVNHALDNLTSANNRYKFVATVGSTTYSWGCSAQSGQGAPPVTLDGNYFRIYQNAFSPGANRTHYTFRHMTELSNQEIDVILDMSSANDYYTHMVDAGDLTVYPVTDFVTPAEGAALELSKVNGSAQVFEWTPSTGTGPTPKYSVVFFSDAGGTNEIGSYTASNDGLDASVSILHTTLESVAANAGIAQEGTGDVWWSVNTTVLTNSEIASIPPRKLTLVRFPGIPEDIFITGAASEGGTTLGDALPFKRTAAGIFEIYTKLTAGDTYHFVTANSGTPRQFSISGETSIVEGGSTEPSATAVYKIVLDFNTDQATFTEITQVFFFHPWGGNYEELTYQGNAVWSGTFTPSGWATDDRYKFKVATPAKRNDWVGAGHRDSPPTGNEDFYYTMESQYDGEWTGDDGNMWKVPGSSGGWNSNTFTATFSLRADAPYTHNLTW